MYYQGAYEMHCALDLHVLTCSYMFLHVLGVFLCSYMFLHVLGKKWSPDFGVFVKHVVELYNPVKTKHVMFPQAMDQTLSVREH